MAITKADPRLTYPSSPALPSMKTAVLAVLAISVALGVSQPASAKTRPDERVVSRHVSIADLDLSRTKDQHELLTRVHRAAKAVCSIDGSVWSIYQNLDVGYKRCIVQASTKAVASLNNPTIMAMLTGEPPIELASAAASH